jgi:hypothetical protein
MMLYEQMFSNLGVANVTPPCYTCGYRTTRAPRR